MKINLGMRSLQKGLSIHETPQHNQVKQKSFSDTMQQQQEQTSRQQLQKLFEEIQHQSDLLKSNMTVRELLKYKAMVKKFLEETARKGIEIQHQRTWDRRGRSRRFMLLKEVDQHLIEMAEHLLESEEGRMKLLDKIGEIKGLLVNFEY